MRRSARGLPPIDSSSFRGETSDLGYFRRSLYSPVQKRGATGQEVGKSTAFVMGPVALGNRYRTDVQDRCTGEVYRTGHSFPLQRSPSRLSSKNSAVHCDLH